MSDRIGVDGPGLDSELFRDREHGDKIWHGDRLYYYYKSDSTSAFHDLLPHDYVQFVGDDTLFLYEIAYGSMDNLSLVILVSRGSPMSGFTWPRMRIELNWIARSKIYLRNLWYFLTSLADL